MEQGVLEYKIGQIETTLQEMKDLLVKSAAKSAEMEKEILAIKSEHGPHCEQTDDHEKRLRQLEDGFRDYKHFVKENYMAKSAPSHFRDNLVAWIAAAGVILSFVYSIYNNSVMINRVLETRKPAIYDRYAPETTNLQGVRK